MWKLDYPFVVAILAGTLGAGCATVKQKIEPKCDNLEKVKPKGSNETTEEENEAPEPKCAVFTTWADDLNPDPPHQVGFPRCPTGLAFVTAGNRPSLSGMKIAGGPLVCANEPEAPVGPFCMDVNEVSVSEYAGCVENGSCPAPLACRENKSWGPETSEVCAGPIGAEAYCRWRGLRLASFDEWVRAASNGDSRQVPWGNEAPLHEEGLCACRELSEGPCKTRRVTRDISAHGIRDLGANASEWITGGRCIGQGWWKAAWPPMVRTDAESCGNFRHTDSFYSYCGIRCVSDPIPIDHMPDIPYAKPAASQNSG